MKALTYFSSLLCAAAIMVGCSSSEQETAKVIDATAKARIDSTLTAFVANGKVAGASALVYEDGKEVYFGAFGFADKEARKPMDRNTIVKVYSMTKPITGTALMTLYEEGKFDLDDPLAKYAPEFADMTVYVGRGENGEYLGEPLERPITIRDLTRHTAGFGTSTSIPGLGELIADADASDWKNTLTEMAEKMGKTPLWFQPGTQWQYGPSVDVQAFLVERISGQPYHEYVREHVLDPLGMEETRYVVPQKDIDRFSASYTQTESGLAQLPNEEAHAFNLKKWPLTPGGFGLTSTLDDYMKFAQMLVNGGSLNENTVLKPETVKLMATNHLDESIEERSWLPSKGQVGFGIDFAVRLREPQSAEENNGVVGEFFWDGAATTLFWVDPVNKLTAVFFVQVFPFDGTLHKGFRDAVYGPLN